MTPEQKQAVADALAELLFKGDGCQGTAQQPCPPQCETNNVMAQGMGRLNERANNSAAIAIEQANNHAQWFNGFMMQRMFGVNPAAALPSGVPGSTPAGP